MTDAEQIAFTQGKATGFALAAAAISALAFFQFLGLERALLGIVLAGIALRTGGKHFPRRSFAFGALILSLVWLVVAGATLYFAGDELMNLLQRLEHDQ